MDDKKEEARKRIADAVEKGQPVSEIDLLWVDPDGIATNYAREFIRNYDFNNPPP